ncbi:MAG: hypothetical protein K9K63_12270 [Desulfotignum sp.]|nr:hypothetical protein [Desulfotignum sp.]MCF8088735.1 hypothetical protein [Desulfotignum sp.]MCF8138074.1 hypothetical protein [Desulfotignum sp.]
MEALQLKVVLHLVQVPLLVVEQVLPLEQAQPLVVLRSPVVQELQAWVWQRLPALWQPVS